MKNSKLLLSLLLALVTLTSGRPSHALNTFTMRIEDEPETLDWNRAHTPIETYILLNIMEGLVAFDSQMKVQPALAKSWTISPDGKTYTFKLRDGVKWTDGVPLKAKDFVYSWKRLLSPITAAAYAYFLFDVAGAEDFNKGKLKDFSAVGVKALDDQTLQVKLARRVAHWIQLPTFWVTFPVREDVVQKHGPDWEKPGRVVTLGPYSMISHDIDSKIVLKANPNYYGQKGNIEQITALIVKDASTALTLYESGKIDFLNTISTLDLKRFEKSPDLKVFPYLKTAYIGFLTNKYPITNPKIRRAISMAIDKNKFGDILHGHQTAATSFVPPPLMASSKSLGLPFDPTRAKAELKSAGLDTAASLKLEILLPNWDKPIVASQFIQNELKKNLGIDVSLQPYDNKTYRSQLDMRTFPLYLTSWSADYPDADNFLSLFLSGAGNNRTNWKNAKYDQLVLNARNLTDPKARAKIYLEAQKILLEQDAAILPLYYEPNLALVKPRVHGLELNPLNYLLLKKVSVSP